MSTIEVSIQDLEHIIVAATKATARRDILPDDQLDAVSDALDRVIELLCARAERLLCVRA